MQSPQSTTPPSFDEVLRMTEQWNANEKIAFAKILERETFAQRFDALLQTIPTDDINDGDIVREVKAERAKRAFDNGKR